MSPPRRGSRQGRGRSTSEAGAARRYPRTARVNRLLLEVLAETLERLVAGDERLSMLTVTAVDADPDFATATVFFSTLDDEELEALGDARVRLQAEIGRQVRLKRTPLLRFAADPAVASGRRVEEILRELDLGDADTGDAATGEAETGEAETGEAETGEAETGEADGAPSPGWP